MDDCSSTAATVAHAIAAALDWSSSPDSRKAAVSYLESVKSGDVQTLASTSLLLVRRDWPSEIRLHGFKMLQHLVRFRWDELNITERRVFANLTISIISELVNPHEEWALKSQTAALVAEVVRREGMALWHELLPTLVSLSVKSPIEAELVAMVLRWLPEDITIHNEDLEGDRRRVLLCGLTESLTEILPLLYTLLEKHFGAALREFMGQQIDAAKQHATAVIASLNAINAYAEWAPVPDLAKYGLIHGCGSLLTYNEFRLHACEFFKFISQRKRPTDNTTVEFDSAMMSIFQILVSVSRDFFNKSKSNFNAIDETEFEFMESICECMVTLASSNAQCITGDGAMASQFLQQMLEYYQHVKFALHFQSLLFWLVMMREPVSKAKASIQNGGENFVGNSGNGSQPSDKEKIIMSVLVNDDICAAILDISFLRMLKKNLSAGNLSTQNDFELWDDEFDSKTDFSQYRSRLLELIKLIAVQKSLLAATRVSERINMIFKTCAHASMSAQDLALIESAQMGLETAAGAIFDGPVEFANIVAESKFQLHTIFEGLLQLFLSLRWTEPAPAVILCRYLNSLGPYFKYYPDSIASVVNKLFELLTSLPIEIKDPSFSNARQARLQICTSFIHIAKTAGRSLLPHMKLLHCIHSLWSEPITQALTREIRAAKSMNHAEKASLLGKTPKLLKDLSTSGDGSLTHTIKKEELSENDLRIWLKGIRDSGYNVVGLSTTIGDTFFKCIESHSVALALTDNVQSMEYRHLRLLIHSVIIPLVKFCPPNLWELWLEIILQPLLLHCQQTLSCSWSGLLREGRAKVPDCFGDLSGLELKVEVMEEKLLRNLTREVCSLLSTLASPALNTGFPSLDQLGPGNRADSPKDLNAFASNSLTAFLMTRQVLALHSLRIGIDALAWTDGESVNKVIPFCGSIIVLAIITNSVELREIVAKDLFPALIQALSLESNAIICLDLLGLCRGIYVYLADRHPAPRQVMLCLPSITSNDLLAFDDALTKTTSPKEQKQLLKSLLLSATGNKLRALAALKATNIITNVTARTRSSTTLESQPDIEEDSTIGLAAIT